MADGNKSRDIRDLDREEMIFLNILEYILKYYFSERKSYTSSLNEYLTIKKIHNFRDIDIRNQVGSYI